MSIITLPDNISFEELARAWNISGSDRVISYTTTRDFMSQDQAKEIRAQNIMSFVEYDADNRLGYCMAEPEYIADFYPSDRGILIRDEEKFQPLLDYIKERSNG